MPEQLRVGVIGGGLIAQMVHLPTVAAMGDHYRLAALADPSERVRSGLAARYPGIETHADWRDLIAAGSLDAVVVCSPHASHADVVLAALDASINVLVEKPLCIDVADAEAIIARRESTGLVVQVGYMKRYDPGYEAWIEALPGEARDLRLIEVVTRDPSMGRPPFLPDGYLRSDDIPRAALAAGAVQEREQVEAAVGVGDLGSVKAFNYTYLACLIHDVNLIHGAFERLGVELPLASISSAHWADGMAATMASRLPGGGVWNCSWLLLDGLEDFVEDAALYFGDQIHRLSFGVPYMRERPTIHEVISAEGGAEQVRRTAHARDSYRAQLEHLHDCITAGAVCRTPPEQARLDLIALREAFLARAS